MTGQVIDFSKAKKKVQRSKEEEIRDRARKNLLAAAKKLKW